MRDRFFVGDYDITGVIPLTPFPATIEDPFTHFFGDDTFELLMDPCELLDYAKLKKWFREGTENQLMKNVPYPLDADKNPLPHGALLDFDNVPIKYQPRKALVWWARLRHINVPASYPMDPFEYVY